MCAHSNNNNSDSANKPKRRQKKTVREQREKEASKGEARGLARAEARRSRSELVLCGQLGEIGSSHGLRLRVCRPINRCVRPEWAGGGAAMAMASVQRQRRYSCVTAVADQFEAAHGRRLLIELMVAHLFIARQSRWFCSALDGAAAAALDSSTCTNWMHLPSIHSFLALSKATMTGAWMATARRLS